MGRHTQLTMALRLATYAPTKTRQDGHVLFWQRTHRVRDIALAHHKRFPILPIQRKLIDIDIKVDWQLRLGFDDNGVIANAETAANELYRRPPIRLSLVVVLQSGAITAYRSSEVGPIKASDVKTRVENSIGAKGCFGVQHGVLECDLRVLQYVIICKTR